MGYFSNGCESDDYHEKYCFNCVNYRDLEDGRGAGCPIMDLHYFYNYKECNNSESMLHFLIPREDDGLSNKQCSMFLKRA
jgi:hypothetical protein